MREQQSALQLYGIIILWEHSWEYVHKLLQSQAMHLWVRPQGCGCLRAISRLPLPSSLHSICCLSSPFTLPINFPELQIYSETVQRGRELRDETSKWTALIYCEVHKGENTVANIKFPKWGQAKKNEETAKATRISNFVLNSCTRDWDCLVQ